jgi:5-methylcytosine-specific restriction endonuclease McrA
MKDQILKLRKEGKTYDEIKNIIGCSKSTISYYCGNGQKEKNIERKRKRRQLNPLSRKIETFKARKTLKNKTERFQMRTQLKEVSISKNGKLLSRKDCNPTFKYSDIIEKYGDNPHCYLTNRPINWNDPSTYVLDHIIPVSLGGENSLDNLGICCPQANSAKSDLCLEDFFSLCKEILINNGYEVKKLPR